MTRRFSFLPFLCVQHKLEHAVSYKGRISKVSSLTKSHLQKLIHSRRLTKEDLPKGNSLEDISLSCPCAKLSESRILIMEGVETGFQFQTLFSNCTAKMKTFQTFIFFPDISDSDSESNCQGQREAKLSPIRNLKLRICKKCTNRVVLLMEPGKT